MLEMQKKLAVTDCVSETSQIKRVENYPEFEKLAHIIQHGLLTILQMIVVIFCRSK